MAPHPSAATVVLVGALVGALATSCAEGADEVPVALLEIPADATAGGTPVVRPRVLQEVPHDTGSFTQGLELGPDGRLYESAGLYGRSDVRVVDATTGTVTASTGLDEALFAEGLTVVDDRIIQLTWREERALVYDLDLVLVDEYDYEGQGWGLCHDGFRLVMSDGSSSLTFRDSATFAETGSVRVELDGDPVPDLNELECVDGLVYANVWKTDAIVVIDPADGAVVQVVDASGLWDGVTGDRVLNGIAHDVATGAFLLTGKQWPTLYEVELAPPA